MSAISLLNSLTWLLFFDRVGMSNYLCPPLLERNSRSGRTIIRLMNGRPIGQRFSTNRTIVYCVASDLVVGWGGGEVGFLKGTMVSFTTIHGPLRRQAAVLPGVSCKRSTFVSPAFPDP